MRFSHESYLTKIAGVLRFLVIRLYYLRKLKAAGLSIVGRKTDFMIRGSGSIQANGRFILSGYNQLYSSGKLVIGKNVSVNEYSRIMSRKSIEIGNNVVIAKFVTILDHDHAYSLQEGNLSFADYVLAPIVIGNNVWLADKVTVMKGVTIGDNVIIGANSVVSKDIPSNCIAAGIPCKVIKRFEE